MGALLAAENATLGAEILAVLQAFALLALVGLCAFTVRRVLKSARERSGVRLAVEERLSLDLRNALVIVRVDERRLLLATSDRGPARLVTELTASLREPAAPSPSEAAAAARVAPTSQAREPE